VEVRHPRNDGLVDKKSHGAEAHRGCDRHKGRPLAVDRRTSSRDEFFGLRCLEMLFHEVRSFRWDLITVAVYFKGGGVSSCGGMVSGNW